MLVTAFTWLYLTKAHYRSLVLKIHDQFRQFGRLSLTAIDNINFMLMCVLHLKHTSYYWRALIIRLTIKKAVRKSFASCSSEKREPFGLHVRVWTLLQVLCNPMDACVFSSDNKAYTLIHTVNDFFSRCSCCWELQLHCFLSDVAYVSHYLCNYLSFCLYEDAPL